MHRVKLIFMLMALMLPGTGMAASVEILRDIPHDPGAFTQGLIFHQGRLYESTGKYGRSALRIIDPATGKLLKDIRLSPRYFGEGLSVCAGRLFQLTWKSEKCLVYDLELNKIQETGYLGQGWGLCRNATCFVMSDGSSRLSLRSLNNFKKHRELAVTFRSRPVPNLNELEWVRGKILANVWMKEVIAVIDPATGKVGKILDMSFLRPRLSGRPGVLNGLAYDPDKDELYVTGKNWGKVFVVRGEEALASD